MMPITLFNESRLHIKQIHECAEFWCTEQNSGDLSGFVNKVK